MNHPFIHKKLTLKASGWLFQLRKYQSHVSSLPDGTRLFQRVRRRLMTVRVPLPIHTRQLQAWYLLCDITAPGRLSFDTCRRIRSAQFHDWEVYGLYRLANHIAQPTQSVAKNLLQRPSILETAQFQTGTVQSPYLFWHIQLLRLMRNIFYATGCCNTKTLCHSTSFTIHTTS